MGKPIGKNRAEKEQESNNNFPAIISDQQPKEDEPLKSILIKLESSTHKKLMQMKVDTGLTMNDYIVSAIKNQLHKDGY